MRLRLTGKRMLWGALRLGLAAAMALTATVGTAQEPAPTEEPPQALEEGPGVTVGQARATVFLMQVYYAGRERIISCVGSGTLVSPDGLILTNAHSARATQRCRTDDVVVALTVRDDEPPVPIYLADLVAVDAALDLAVLRITRYLDGRLVQPSALLLPFVELGDSEALALGDAVTVIGYPGIGQDPVQVREGTVSAFMAEARTGSRAWIKTDASIPGMMSGGGAYNRAGRLIGVPTIAPAGTGGQTIDCRAVQDTNADGLIDSSDTCIPIGGFINTLRPARLARPLLRAAQFGLRPGELPARQPTAAQPAFSRLFFAPSVNEAGQPSTVLAQAPTGTSQLYLFWDYRNLTEDMVYELRVTVNGVADARLSLPPVLWSGGESGVWYLGISDMTLPDGAYEFQLFAEGQPAGTARINVGGPALAVGSFTDLVFGVEAPDGSLMGSGHLLPSGVNVINARFVYQNMIPDTPWSEAWYYEGAPLYRNDAAWIDGANGVKTLRVSSEQGLLPGRYRLELFLGGRLATTADFVIAGGAVGPTASVFGPITFADAVSPAGTPAGLAGPAGGVGFPAGGRWLHAFFSYQNIAPGTEWVQRWYVDNDYLFTIRQTWTGAGTGDNLRTSLEGIDRLPDGTYRLELLIGNRVLQTGTAVVGTGVNTVRPLRSSGVRMVGQVVDAETGRGIAGALFILLRAEFSVEDFVWDGAQVLATSLTDIEGYFEIPVRLPLDAFYSVVIRAEGYLPVNADAIRITAETPDPLVLRLEMNKD